MSKSDDSKKDKPVQPDPKYDQFGMYRDSDENVAVRGYD